MLNLAEFLKSQFQNSLGYPLAQILTDDLIETALAEAQVSYRQTVYTPAVTLWSWISQVVDSDKSQRNAVSRIQLWRSLYAQLEEVDINLDTSSYCKARQRLSLGFLMSVFFQLAAEASQSPTAAAGWCGRRVKAFDGTTVQMLDTPENQKVYPQHSNQKPGCGFPLAKVVVWFCVRTGVVLQSAIADLKTSEWQLSRQLYADLEPEDVVVADSAYGTYADLALVQAQQADGVFRKHHARHCDFRKGKRLGHGDHLVTWTRPDRCPDSMSQEEFEALPPTLEVREVKLTLTRPGWRSRTLIVVTTLLDPKEYPKEQLAELYRLRWSAAEVNLGHLKTTLKMEMIQAKTPEMVEKDLWVHLIAYNLLRLLMLQAGQVANADPLQISFQATRQLFNQFRSELLQASKRFRALLYKHLLALIASELIPLRPNRAEPRVLKQRPKPFPRMQHYRAVLRTRLAS